MSEDEINVEAAKWYDSYAESQSDDYEVDWWEEYEEYMRGYNDSE